MGKTVSKIVKISTLGLVDLDSMFKQPKPQTPKAPPPMPSVDDQAQRRAQRDALVRQRSRQGRASTVLTNDDGGLG